MRPIAYLQPSDLELMRLRFFKSGEVRVHREPSEGWTAVYVEDQVAALTASHAALLAALEELLVQRNNIEVLGEWSALDINFSMQKKARASIDATVDKARVAINSAKELG